MTDYLYTYGRFHNIKIQGKFLYINLWQDSIRKHKAGLVRKQMADFST